MDFLLNFHFIRPWWFLTLPVTALFIYLFVQKNAYPVEWKNIVSVELQKHLLFRKGNVKIPLFLLGIIWFGAILALAGPTFRKIPHPLQQSENPLAIILDLSPSMNAEDVAPSRIDRARNKISDVLKQRNEGMTALIIYGAEAFSVVPLTDDKETIINLLPTLSPQIIPKRARGNNPLAAFEQAQKLLAGIATTSKQLLLLTDGITLGQEKKLQKWLSEYNFKLSILGIGTRGRSAPIPSPGGGFLRDSNGQLQVTKFNPAPLRRLAASSGGRYHNLTLNDDDINYLLLSNSKAGKTRETERKLDIWHEEGPWIVLLLLPLAVMSFRRGWLLLLTFFLWAEPVQALTLKDFFLRDDQKALNLLKKGENEKAAELFNDELWQGTALYRNGEYESALQVWPTEGNANLHYNRGNALALTGKLKEAISAYDAALDLNPNMKDAGHNREILMQLLKNAEPNQEQQGQSEQKKGETEQANKENAQDISKNQQMSEDQQMGEEGQKQHKENQMKEKENGEKSEEKYLEQQAKKEEEKNNEKQGEENSQMDSSKPEEEDLLSLLERVGSAGDENEQEQQLESSLQHIKDNPEGLLRNKLYYQYQKRLQEGTQAGRDENNGL